MSTIIEARNLVQKEIFQLGEGFYGKSPCGEELAFSNYFLQRNKKPFFAISGELHFSRVNKKGWKDELLKMKSGGVNVVSTYVFWNHHEEVEGKFRFDGCRDLRGFIQICQEVGLYVIVRIGPFNHGEARNGGLPDWLYGKPFEVRAINRGFLDCVNSLYQEFGVQMEGMYYKDGGPIIGVQLDNEYQHSAAPWELTTGTSNEWITTGTDGEAYLEELMKIAKANGIQVPFYTCTAWGGAATPSTMLPLWGGYAYRPWLFYSYKGDHPLTDEYLYTDFHNNGIKKTKDFEPKYLPEERPYACCEMGGGMMCSYHYRFQLPYKSVDAMANIKIASGCNFIGYYMFHGGTNPKGEVTEFLNESQVSKISYDYQGAIGEFGQIRESYKRLKTLHYFTKYYQELLCETQTVLPSNVDGIVPEDVDTLRVAARLKEERGFLFINNFQDHAQTKEKTQETVTIKTASGDIVLKNISLAADENGVLPIHLDLGGILLKYALAQPVARWVENNVATHLFMVPEGMKEELIFEEGTKVVKEKVLLGNQYIVTKDEAVVHIYMVSREVSNHLYCIEREKEMIILATKGAVMVDEDKVRVEIEYNLGSYSILRNGRWTTSRYENLIQDIPIEIFQVGETRYILDLKNEMKTLRKCPYVKHILLKINYQGDIGTAFINGQMVHDNFANGTTWEIQVSLLEEQLEHHPLTIYITPLKEGAKVNVESSMAGRKEEVEYSSGRLLEATLVPILEHKILI